MRSFRVVAACTVALAVGARGAGAQAPEVVTATLSAGATQAVVEVTVAPGWHVNSNAPDDEFLIPTALTLTAPPGVRAGAVAYPRPVARKLAFGGGRSFQLFEGTVRLTAPLEGPRMGVLRGALRYQACDDTRCLPPKTLELATDLGAPAPAPGARGGVPEGNRIAGWVARWGWPLTFLLVTLGGVALNLTPCVYPLISVTVAFFAGRTAGHPRHALGRALVFVLGICLSFSVLGTVAALTGSLFGAALQQPAVVAGIAGVCVVLAASNFGLYQLRLPSALAGRLGGGGEGSLGAFVMGLTMGLVAAPCIGPFVVALLVFVAAEQSAPLGFALFFALGAGLGAPYVVLAALAGRVRRLPRSGAWLAWVEHVFGFLLLGLALWFAAPILPAGSARLLGVVLLVAAGVWLGFLGPRTGPVLRLARRLGGVGLVALALVGFLRAETPGTLGWEPFSEEALARAAAAGRPVLLDFQARWCLPCREMEHTTFRDPAFTRVADGYTTLVVDVTQGDEAANALMARWGVVGVPTYILLGPDGEERRRFVGYVPAAEMVPAMAALLGTPRA